MKKKWFIVFEIVLSPLTIISCYWLKLCKRKLYVSPFTKSIFDFTGVFPILDHYYEPLYNKKHLRKSLREDRNIVSLDFNDAEQIKLIDKFSYNDELLAFPRKRTSNPLEFSYNYGDYPSGDSESLYNMMRTIKPKRMIEVGCGSSTLMAINAMKMNKKENENYDCEYTCIEPYEQPWLEKTGLKVLRKKVEDVPLDFFKTLAENDILFIDSSHMIRPQGDVLYEILEILPALNSGVIIHFHDICTPKDYFDEWVGKFMWNEQYILEAFLSNNKEYEIILSTNYLLHHHYEKFISKCPVLKFDKEQNPIRETGAFWIRKK
ncbi:MAG: hypothetical protein A2W98_01205 [Bacteroidetes bacterium GWF2_33_38]|nr:MAG: hypothetical protein A2W98_01205 [Bacteroidetes bacterium GWF2_33_38]OFY73585.1 MAG: hypothetical protein A2265_02465 [Bacteroidetes bacterium RIFOXYA12_FULL_33_9]HBX50588.1 hypothetical protein [Bacteroidales bacterium]